MTAAEPPQPKPTDISSEQAQVERDIKEAREELGGIAEALARRANLRAQAQRRVTAFKAQARARGERVRAAAAAKYRAQPTDVAAGAGAAVVLIVSAVAGAVLWRRR